MEKTLDSGERVIAHPPDDAHPQGREVLVPGPSPLRERLQAQHEDKSARHQDLVERQRQRIEAKRDALDADPAVPFSKRPL